VILFNVSLLPLFVNPELGHVREQFLVLGVTITLMGLLVDGSVGLLSGKLSATDGLRRRLAPAIHPIGTKFRDPPSVNVGLTGLGCQLTVDT
jgi:threonine/homoserine/homoserine lactone efflux protein